MFNCTLGGDYCNPSFGEVFNSAESFLEGYKNCGIPTLVSDESVTTLFYLIYARYGSSPIKSNDKNLFAYKCYQIIFQYAPTWEKNMEIQKALRDLSLEAGSELYVGSKAIYNHAMHDGSTTPTKPLTELGYIDSQNTTNYQKSRIEGLARLYDMLRNDVTSLLLDKFKPLFSNWLRPDSIPYFATEVD